ncbi:MAG: hypothetical protein IMZ66_06000 [Planctomycetes bacterium]|nr:hypothetical protein [Planctomycetota bacterium]
MPDDADNTPQPGAVPDEPEVPADVDTPADADAPGEGDDAPAGFDLASPAFRVPTLVVAAVILGLGVRVGQAAFAYEGPLVTALGLFLATMVLLGVGAAAIAVGLVGLPSRRRGSGAAEDIERRAEELGLPTDPAAYQDGGVGVAATSNTIAEAELLASLLNASGVPAWVDQPRAATTLSHAQFAINPAGIRVLVPLGRLEDARRTIAEHPPQGDMPDEDDENAAGAPVECDETAPPEAEAEDESQDREEPARVRPLAKRAISALLCGMGLVAFSRGAFIVLGVARGSGSLPGIVMGAVVGLLGLGLAVAGAFGLRRRG